MKWTARDSDTIARCIAEVEARTEAEVVVVARRYSGSYRDVDFLFGALVAWLALIAAIAAPYDIHPVSLPVPLAFAFLLAALICSSTPDLRRLLTRARRREQQVRREAESQFVHRRVHTTSARTGVLLYYSLLEGRAVLIADVRAEEALGAVRLAEWRARLEECRHDPAAFAAYLRSLGVLLGQVLPVRAGDRNELADMPDIDSPEEET